MRALLRPLAWLVLGALAFACSTPTLLHAQTTKDSAVVVCKACVAIPVPPRVDSVPVAIPPLWQYTASNTTRDSLIQVTTSRLDSVLVPLPSVWQRTITVQPPTYRDSVIHLAVVIPPPVVPPPVASGTAEPVFKPGVSTTVLTEDFEVAGLTDLAKVGWSIIPYQAEPGPLTVETGTGYSGGAVPSAPFVGGALHLHWTKTSPNEADQGISRQVSATSRTLNFSYAYRADPGFVYAAGYPMLGKKHFLFGLGQAQRFTLSIGDNMNDVLPNKNQESRYPGTDFAWSLAPTANNPAFYAASNPNKIDADQDYFPFTASTTKDSTPDNQKPTRFMAYLANGQWHRITVQRVAESAAGKLDGAIRVWVDGWVIIDHSGIGTGTFTSGEMQLASTMNGGSTRIQQEYYDALRVWF